MVIALPRVIRLRGGTPSPGCRLPRSLEVQLETQPDVPRLAGEPLRPEERVVVGVERPVVLGRRVNPIAVTEPRLDPLERLAVGRDAPAAAPKREIDRAVGRQ